MPSILIAPYEAEALRHIRNLCARGFHVTGVTDKPAVEGHPASIEIQYESGDCIAELDAAVTDPTTFLRSCRDLARQVAEFTVTLDKWSESVALYLSRARAECIETHETGYMLAATSIDSAVADLVCAHGAWEREVMAAIEKIREEIGLGD